MVTIAKVFVILAICVLQCFSRPEHEPAANSMADFGAKSSEFKKRITKRASELAGEDAETEMRAAKFNFEDSDEDLNSSFDPYLRAVTPQLNQKTSFTAGPKENQIGAAQTRGISLRSSLLGKYSSDNLQKKINPTTEPPETKQQLDNFQKVQNSYEVEETSQNAGFRSMHADNVDQFTGNGLRSSFMSTGSFDKSLENALEPLLRSIGIKDVQDPQVRSLLGVVTAPFNIVKKVVEGVLHLVERGIKKIIIRFASILDWILPSWIYRAIIPREILRLVDEENQIKRMAEEGYGGHYGPQIQQQPMLPPVQYKQQPNHYPGRRQYGYGK